MRVCLVTGANRGLGLEFTRQLLERGRHVLACCRAPEQAEELNALAREHARRLHVLELDVADPEAIARLPARVSEHTERLDLLVNNAGVLVSGERYGNVQGDSLTESFAVNAMGPLLITQALTALLQRGQDARVVCVSSQIASIAQSSAFRTISYAMSKAALNMAVKRMASELERQGIMVVAVHPGWVRTDMGGETATLSPQQSVHALLDLITQLQPDRAGRFLAYDGSELPW